jgi:ferritin
MLPDNVIDKLNEQIGHELYSATFYLQMSAWCAHEGLDGCARFLRAHSSEELVHMNKLYDYVVDSGSQPLIPAIEKPRHQFESVKEVFTTILEHERFITGKINELVEVTFGKKDFFTFNFLQWYVAEQHEEEALFKTVLDKLELVGQDDRGLFFFDREMGSLRQGETLESGSSGA